MKHRLAAIVLVALTAIVLASVASATTTNYWGFNNLSATNPPAGTCPSYGAGAACAGFNYWDYSQIQINSGSGQALYGFQSCTGCSTKGFFTNPGQTGTFSIIWSASGIQPMPHYNRAACTYFGGTYTYTQCRAIIN